MSYLLPHLHSGWAVDQAILAEEERLVVIRFGHDWDETCMQVTFSLSLSLSNFYFLHSLPLFPVIIVVLTSELILTQITLMFHHRVDLSIRFIIGIVDMTMIQLSWLISKLLSFSR